MVNGRISQIIFVGAALAATLGFGFTPAWALEGVISKGVIAADELGTQVNYCHLRFPAIEPGTLASNHPVLQNPDTGEIVDFYGPCDHDPLGADEVKTQVQEEAFLESHDGE